ncbi:tyrosine-type recombinase/integrase [Saccharibacter sp. 17.LH.SD]|uniref:tyrosine-type recombinase/integrase n=1 Tax=Saccharibacter sp. 17.LH.SD TaxID=2689393 RepID=UPI00136EBB12|nr:site-specific integrase [Saccharibacter sp. 17.LH.SD]MXV43504.1 tyrosine-type recombinase/integrase [Saccharibacter sp. 17.LH.SD]
MPLKLIKRPDSTFWHIIGTVNGRRIRESTGTSSKKRAEEYRAKRESQAWQESIYGAKSVVTFSHAVLAYLEAEPRGEGTKAYLRRLLDFFHDTRLIDINQEKLDEAYKVILKKGIHSSQATKKRAVNTPVCAVMRFAAHRGWCDPPLFAPVKVQTQPVKFLYPKEAIRLIEEAADHLKPLFIFLLGTGARVSEALELEWKEVDLYGKQATIWQKQQNKRRLDLPPIVIKTLQQLPHREGRVFRSTYRRTKADGYHDNGRTSGGQFKRGWAGACRRAGFSGQYRKWSPKGELSPREQFVPDITPHIMRHTWATWNYCLYRDPILLREMGGWKTLKMVEHYSKLIPPVYADEIRSFLGGDFLTRN